MALSDDERRLFEEIARGFTADDPAFAARLGRLASHRRARRRTAAAVAGFLLGAALMTAGTAARWPWLGAAGFVAMLGCAAYALRSRRWAAGPGGAAAGETGEADETRGG